MKLISHDLLQTHHSGGPTPVSLSGRTLTIGWLKYCLILPMLCSCPGLSQAQTNIPIPNGSFESPDVSGELFFAAPIIDSWQKVPEPAGYDSNLFGIWEIKTGVFFNTDLFGPPIENMDGTQGAFLTSFPEVGFFQDYLSIGGTNSTSSNEFDATYDVGSAYLLTVALTTSTSPGRVLTEGATLRFGAYFRDGASNRVLVADEIVTYSTNVFTNALELLDFRLVVPTVQTSNLWAAEYIGVELVSAVVDTNFPGIWDVDHVRLLEFKSPTLTEASDVQGSFGFTLLSDPGAELELITSTNLSPALSNWTSLVVITNVTGVTNYQVSTWGDQQRFYAARRLP